ncbi:hypothetical protein CB1_001876003 [Camelus ferus]|nr:hypothetical protein CB1_001876003 [Camelus ferus]
MTLPATSRTYTDLGPLMANSNKSVEQSSDLPAVIKAIPHDKHQAENLAYEGPYILDRSTTPDRSAGRGSDPPDRKSTAPDHSIGRGRNWHWEQHRPGAPTVGFWKQRAEFTQQGEDRETS